MSNRSTAPDAAFACIMDSKGIKYKLLRHHYIDKVRDGNEHDTVSSIMLSFAIRMVDQIPVSDEEKEKAMAHLREHESALAAEKEQPDNVKESDPQRRKLEKDEDLARRITNEQAGAPDGNQDLKNPRVDLKMEPDNSAIVRKEDGVTTAQLAQDNAGGSITSKDSTPTKKGEKDTDAGSPKGDHQDTLDKPVSDDVEKKPSAGLGKPAHDDTPSEGTPNTARPGVEQDGGEKNVTSPGDVERGSGIPSSSNQQVSEDKKKIEEKKKSDSVHPDILQTNPTGLLKKRPNLENIDIADKNKNQPGIKVQAAIETNIGDWVRNKEGRVGQIVSVDGHGKATVKVPSTGQKVNNEGWQVIVRASEVNKNDPADILQKELRILNSPEALMKFATPTPEGQAARKNKIALCSVQDLTRAGHKFVQERLYGAIAGKVSSKVQSVDKLGSRELVVVRMGDDDEFPISTMLEIRKNKDGKVDAISMFDSFLPAEVFRDFAKFLNNLAKQAPSKSESGAKLERCVSDVLSKKVSDFKKKNGKAPSTDQLKKMKSSAFAICTAQGLK